MKKSVDKRKDIKSDNCYREINNSTNLFFIFLVICIIAIVLIGYCVRINEGNDKGGWITLDAWLTYYGAAIGSIFTGLVTGVGLYITLKTNSLQLERQREYDDARLDKQLKIQRLNEQISDYEKYLPLIDKIKKCSISYFTEAKKYKSNLESMAADAIHNYVKAEAAGNVSTIFKNNENVRYGISIFDNSKIVDLYDCFNDSYEEIKNKAYLLSNTNINTAINEYIEYVNKLVLDSYNKVLSDYLECYNYVNRNGKYKENLNTLNDLHMVSNMIIQDNNIICKIESKEMIIENNRKCKVIIGGIIKSLYDEKYK